MPGRSEWDPIFDTDCCLDGLAAAPGTEKSDRVKAAIHHHMAKNPGAISLLIFPL